MVAHLIFSPLTGKTERDNTKQYRVPGDNASGLLPGVEAADHARADGEGVGAVSNAAEQHAGLFPSVRRKIELLSKLIIEEMEQPQPEDPAPEKREELEDIELSVVRKDGKLDVSLKRGGTDLATESVPATADDLRKGGRRVKAY